MAFQNNLLEIWPCFQSYQYDPRKIIVAIQAVMSIKMYTPM